MLPSAPDLRLVCSSCVDPYTLEASIYAVRRFVCCLFPESIKEPFHENIVILIFCYPLCVTFNCVLAVLWLALFSVSFPRWRVVVCGL